MSKNASLVLHVCKPYCAYYKAGKNEDLLCRGAEVALDILKRSGGSPDSRSKTRPRSIHAAQKSAEELCLRCSFRERDCDFTQDRKARPCGGYLYIVELLTSGAITIEQIRRE
jgi:hypothetical protein